MVELLAPRQVTLHESVNEDDFLAVRATPLLRADIQPVGRLDHERLVRLRTSRRGRQENGGEGSNIDDTSEHVSLLGELDPCLTKRRYLRATSGARFILVDARKKRRGTDR